MNTLPREAEMGDFIRFRFTPALGDIVLYVHKIHTFSILGFDLISGLDKYLPIKSDGFVYGDHNWPAENITIIGATEVRLLLKKRVAGLEADAARHLAIHQELSLRVEGYKKYVPHLLEKLKVLSDA